MEMHFQGFCSLSLAKHLTGEYTLMTKLTNQNTAYT